jgi:phage pi2 protein 07
MSISIPSRLAIVPVALVLLNAAMPTLAAPMSDIDRERLLTHLEMTEGWLVSELEGLSPEQLRFKMAPDTWSIMDVVEHLAIAEPQYWQRVQDSMKQPASDKKPEATDAGILWYGIDRTNRQRTGEARVPKGRYDDVRKSLADFQKLRVNMKEYARSTQDDLRSRMLLEGNMDVWQWFLMISTHSQRHILQIREIKAHPNYPRK